MSSAFQPSDSSGWPTFLKWLLTDAFRPIERNQEKIMSDLQNAFTKMQANTAKIQEIAADMKNVMDVNTQLLTAVKDLESRLPAEALVKDIVGLVETQGASLDSIAASWPEASNSPSTAEAAD
jgi:predicted RNase H-related nuclease YkuK (DUF458 family)